MGTGYLKIKLYLGDDVLPVGKTRVLVKRTDGSILYDLMADENGLTEKVPFEAPDKSYSLYPNSSMPLFSVCDVDVPRTEYYKAVIVHGVQIFDGETSILPIQMHPLVPGAPSDENTDEIYIPREHGIDEPHGPMSSDPADYDGEIRMTQILANEVSIPEYITVHLGSPNATVNNVRVTFIDYIKNVASSEIFPTWEESALYANIYAQISFTLNRVYTVWYRSRGYEFDITNSTAFDQSFVYGRNIFENISRIVDRIFNNFIRRLGRKEPFIASYCNGTTSTCAGMSQWGSQDLALRGYTPIQILRYYYPNDVQIVESTNFTADIGTYPGTALKEGSSGANVRRMQLYLNRISGNFYIPQIPNPDGYFGTATKNSVMEFQRINNLAADGIIGRATWYKITVIYVGVTQLAELTSEGQRIGIGTTPPTVVLQMNSRGEYVVELQFLLNYISEFYPTIPFVVQDGVFRDATKRAVTEFQKQFGLTPDGVVGPSTWNKLYDVFHSIEDVVTPPAPGPGPVFPGTALRVGSRGDSVLLMQQYLNAIAKVFPVIPTLTADGVFGTGTQAAVMAFQSLFGLTVDGVIGMNTWNKIVSVYNNLPNVAVPTYPGTALRVGSRGNDVILMQKYLNTIAQHYTAIPTLTADGIFGTMTENAVKAFQRLFGLTVDGVIGRNTWNTIVSVYNLLGMNTFSIFSTAVTEQPGHELEKYALLLAFNMLMR